MSQFDIAVLNEYLNSNQINPAGLFAKDIESANMQALDYICYCIDRFPGRQDIQDKIRAIATTDLSGKDQFDIERKYYNKLTEFNALEIITEKYKHTLSAVETDSQPIFSPHKNGDGSCDIKTSYDGMDYYWEVKDCSSELTSSEVIDDVIHFTPKFVEDLKSWLNKKSQEAVKKGANYLVCRVPRWNDPEAQPLTLGWMRQIFSEVIESGGTFYIERFYPDFFKGVVFIDNHGSAHVEMR